MDPSTRSVRSLRLVPALILMVAFCLSPITQLPQAMAKVGSNDRPPVAEEKIGNTTYQVSKLLVNAPLDDVWVYINDWKNAPNVFPTVKKCKVVEDKGATRVLSMVIHPSDCPFTYEYTLECRIDKAHGYSEWHRVKRRL